MRSSKEDEISTPESALSLFLLILRNKISFLCSFHPLKSWWIKPKVHFPCPRSAPAHRLSAWWNCCHQYSPLRFTHTVHKQAWLWVCEDFLADNSVGLGNMTKNIIYIILIIKYINKNILFFIFLTKSTKNVTATWLKEVKISFIPSASHKNWSTWCICKTNDLINIFE